MPRLSLIVALCLVSFLHAAEDYKLTADSEERPNIPHGSVTDYKFSESKIFPGTSRSYWIYLPPNFNADTEYPFMVFFDGGGEVQPKGGFRVPIVFDNLINDKQIPPLVGIFINPGDVPGVAPGARGRSTRSYEYDTPTDLCARFVIEEIVPLVQKHAKLSAKADDHAIWGISSGGIAAFNAAWQRPDYFHKVISYIGSFTNIQGGFWFPDAIRKTERKPIRVFLQEGSNDLDNVHGNWPLSNQQMAHALKFAGYDYKFTMGDGGHSGKQGGAILPDALRWLWRPAEALPAPTPEVPNDMALSGILIPGEDWKLVADRKSPIGAACVDADGNFYFCEQDAGVFKIAPDDTISLFNAAAGQLFSMQFAPDGRLIGCSNKANALLAYGKDGKEEVLERDVVAGMLAINHRGDVYYTELAGEQRIMLYQGPGKLKPVDAETFNKDTPRLHHLLGLGFSPNQETLAVSDYFGRAMFAFRVEADGSLTSKIPLMPYSAYVSIRNATENAKGTGVVCDTRSRYYCGTAHGIDTYDPNGRSIGLIAPPSEKAIWNIALAGQDMSFLFAQSEGKIYKRKVNAHGFASSAAPILPEEKKKPEEKKPAEKKVEEKKPEEKK